MYRVEWKVLSKTIERNCRRAANVVDKTRKYQPQRKYEKLCQPLIVPTGMEQWYRVFDDFVKSKAIFET
jgi:hypothetical protein